MDGPRCIDAVDTEGGFVTDIHDAAGVKIETAWLDKFRLRGRDPVGCRIGSAACNDQLLPAGKDLQNIRRAGSILRHVDVAVGIDRQGDRTIQARGKGSDVRIRVDLVDRVGRTIGDVKILGGVEREGNRGLDLSGRHQHCRCRTACGDDLDVAGTGGSPAFCKIHIPGSPDCHSRRIVQRRQGSTNGAGNE